MAGTAAMTFRSIIATILFLASFLVFIRCSIYIEKNKKSQFSGIKKADVIISNASEASTAAVNELLKNGKVVAMIDDKDSEFYGDFICNYNDYLTVADKYTLSATGITCYADNYPSAKVITKAGEVIDLPLQCKGLTDDEKLILKEGCLMNYYAAGYGKA